MLASAQISRTATAFVLCLPLLVTTSVSAQVFVDDFNDNSIDPNVWSVELYGLGAEVAEQNQELEFTMTAGASGGEFGARLTSVFLLRGDFDIQIDFRLLEWPYFNGVRMAVAITDALYDDYGVERSSLSASEPLGAQEVYVADFTSGPIQLVPTLDLGGRLRLVRSGSTQTGYYYGSGGWIPILTGPAPTGDMTIQLHAWSHDYAFQHQVVRSAFDNFTIMSGEIVWPPTPAEVTSWGLIKSPYR